eukprot:6363794-Pyramimonas_sp.AAC.1
MSAAPCLLDEVAQWCRGSAAAAAEEVAACMRQNDVFRVSCVGALPPVRAWNGFEAPSSRAFP